MGTEFTPASPRLREERMPAIPGSSASQINLFTKQINSSQKQLIMVTVINYHVRQTRDGKDFVTLTLQGDVELVQSMETGKFYATARKCSISSTFNEQTAKTLIGSKMPGTIKRVQSDPYDFTIQDTGEVIKLAHSYEYSPEVGDVEIAKRRLEMA